MAAPRRARRTNPLDSLFGELTSASGIAAFRRLDVTDTAPVQAVMGAARERYGRVGVVVNNAGVAPLSPLETLRTHERNHIIDVNVRGVLPGIGTALPESGTAAVYCATKFAVRAISEGLSQESAADIRATLVSADVIRSELAEAFSAPIAGEVMRAYRTVALQASAVAEAILYAVTRPPQINVNELAFRSTASAQCLPTSSAGRCAAACSTGQSEVSRAPAPSTNAGPADRSGAKGPTRF
ncbi:SDR family NAD(P)-dependent oxidoreductase [Kitasatospora sp. RG8]|uniref:SDR family oxidoreductase n=1 Tax=Kitasatospora sp. RG8 TaxID=2820815 RepID=UPI001ADEF73B|nr:SDR family NAD(P)-dependent oxidoreductase [Kitasatospora sp. RG8]MBP0455712.1 SDR family NAD(P)-dependent oxidoreductase [Kitasatospora sp. RG8]